MDLVSVTDKSVTDVAVFLERARDELDIRALQLRALLLVLQHPLAHHCHADRHLVFVTCSQRVHNVLATCGNDSNAARTLHTLAREHMLACRPNAHACSCAWQRAPRACRICSLATTERDLFLLQNVFSHYESHHRHRVFVM